jgi:aryl-alcohol dehydrogenase-like predicted oxidoreductase
MRYRELGNTGLLVSEIGMGCEGFSENNCAMTKELFDLAEREGINYFDAYLRFLYQKLTLLSVKNPAAA